MQKTWEREEKKESISEKERQKIFFTREIIKKEVTSHKKRKKDGEVIKKNAFLFSKIPEN